MDAQGCRKWISPVQQSVRWQHRVCLKFMASEQGKGKCWLGHWLTSGLNEVLIWYNNVYCIPDFQPAISTLLYSDHPASAQCRSGVDHPPMPEKMRQQRAMLALEIIWNCTHSYSWSLFIIHSRYPSYKYSSSFIFTMRLKKIIGSFILIHSGSLGMSNPHWLIFFHRWSGGDTQNMTGSPHLCFQGGEVST